MKVVFVTGSEGFVGQRLVQALRSKGMDVHTVDIIPGPGPNHHVADIRRKEIVDLIPQEADAIIHLAGLTRNPDCQNKAYACFDANVMATLNLIDAAESKKVRQFIFASSEWLYGEWKDNSIRDEEYPLNALTLSSEYAFSKLVSEVNLKQKYQHGFCSVTALRFGIIYGPREKNWSAVESLFNAVKTKEEVQVGSLKTGRCFIHVEDIVSGIVSSLGLDGFNIINLQGDKLITLGDIIDTSKKILGKNPKVIETAPDNYNIRNITNTKAAKLIGWKPRFGLREGLKSLMTNEKETVLK
jgi:UDP-glucose 4-epimerase